MARERSRDHAAHPAYPISAILAPFPLVCFTLALLTDIAFWLSVELMWQNFSAWLLLAGLVFGGLAVLAGIIDLFRPSTRLFRPSLGAILGFLAVLALAVLNSLVHAGDGWTAVVPYGLALSVVTFVVILVTILLGRSTAHLSRAVGVIAYE